MGRYSNRRSSGPVAMTAKYAGMCVACGQPFAAGSAIVYLGRGAGCKCADCGRADMSLAQSEREQDLAYMDQCGGSLSYGSQW